MSKSSLFHRLDHSPVCGISMANVCLLRLDQQGGQAPGNKWYKLQGNIEHAKSSGINTLVSFGGAWSNHLHALAAIGRELGLRTVGIVRGEKPAVPSAMLCDAREWGMELIYVSRQEYKCRNQSDYLAEVRRRYSPCLLIPEGGANSAGVDGCKAIGALIAKENTGVCRVTLAVGTGTTLAGVVMGLADQRQSEEGVDVVGISVLKGAHDLDTRVEGLLRHPYAPWKILHDHHCGGYARVNSALREFILSFQRIHNVPLDPVYTGKALFAVHQLMASGVWEGDMPIVLIHTGGLQGRRGFSWLS